MEGGFGRAFKSSVQPVELAHKLAKEMGDHKTVGVSNVYVPNEFEIYLGADDYEHLTSFADSLKTELANYSSPTPGARAGRWWPAAHRAARGRRPAHRRVRYRHAHRNAPAASRRAAGRAVAAPPVAVPLVATLAPGPLLDQTVLYDQRLRPRRPPRPRSARAACAAGDHELRESVTRHRPQPPLRHRHRRPQRVASARRDPASGRRLRRPRPRFHQRTRAQPARRQTGDAAEWRPHRGGHHRAAVREAVVTQVVVVVGAGLTGASWAGLFAAAGLEVRCTTWTASGSPAPWSAPPRRRASSPAAASPTGRRRARRRRAHGDRRPRQARRRRHATCRSACARTWRSSARCSPPSTRPRRRTRSSARARRASPSATSRRRRTGPERCLAAHPYNPPHLVPLVELAPGALTSPEAMERAAAFYRASARSRSS